MIDRHMNVSGKDRNQKCDQPPGGYWCEPRKKKETSEDDLKQTAQINEQQMPR